MPRAAKEERQQRLIALGRAIRTRRETLGLTQTELAKEIGAFQPEISLIELGDKSLGVARIWEICDALGVTPSQIFSIAEGDSDTDDD